MNGLRGRTEDAELGCSLGLLPIQYYYLGKSKRCRGEA